MRRVSITITATATAVATAVAMVVLLLYSSITTAKGGKFWFFSFVFVYFSRFLCTSPLGFCALLFCVFVHFSLGFCALLSCVFVHFSFVFFVHLLSSLTNHGPPITQTSCIHLLRCRPVIGDSRTGLPHPFITLLFPPPSPSSCHNYAATNPLR